MNNSTVFEGLRVVEFAQGSGGPLTGMILADNGADVVKVEPPLGDWARALPGFRMWGRGKSSIALDLHREADRAEARQLASSADVVIASWRPGRGAAFGLDYRGVAEANPGIVYCSITGFGRLEHLEQLHSYEGVVAARTGRMMALDGLSGAVVKNQGNRPIFTDSWTASYGAGVLAFEGIAASLLNKLKGGGGRELHVSLLDGLTACTMRLQFERDGNGIVRRNEHEQVVHAGIMLSFMTAECGDGKFIQMCARQDAHFQNWLRVLGLEDLLSDSRFSKGPMGFVSVKDVQELDVTIRGIMRQRNRDEWMHLFVSNDVGADPFLSGREFLEHEQMVLNGRVVELQDPEVGLVKQPGPLFQFDVTPSRIGRPAPRLGERRPDAAGWVGSSKFAVEGEDLVAARTENHIGSASEQLPLLGITIVEFATFLAGPLGTTMLAELGARVIKVEPIQGDPFRRTGVEFALLAAGKESIALDMKNPASADIVRNLVSRSDAVLCNFRPNAAKRLGIDYETVRLAKPNIVYLNALSYGSHGSQSNRAAMHSTPHALCGGGFRQAGQGNDPVDDSYPDPCAGLAVAAGIVSGLLARQRQGVGQYIETTMLASAAYVHGNNLTFYPEMHAPPVPDGNQYGWFSLYRLYQCKEGWIFLAAVRREERALLASVLSDFRTFEPEVESAEPGSEADEDLARMLEAVFLSASAVDWELLFREAGVPAAIASAGAFEEFLHRESMVYPAYLQSVGDYWGIRRRIRFGVSDPLPGSACGLGEHTLSILQELGYTEGDIEELDAEGVIRCGE